MSYRIKHCKPTVSALSLVIFLSAFDAKPSAADSGTDSALAAVAETFYAKRVRAEMLSRARETGDAKHPDVFYCLASTDDTAIGRALAPALRVDLTPGEAQDLIAFMQSPAGEKFRWAKASLLRRRTLPAPVSDWTEEERDAVRMFANTPGGARGMSGSDSLLLSSAIETFKNAVYQKCVLSRDPALAESRPVEMTIKETPCSAPRPFYPASARRYQQSGRVDVRLWVNTEGLVYLTAIQKSSAIPALDQAAEEAVQKMRCAPLNNSAGRATPYTAAQPINFQLE